MKTTQTIEIHGAVETTQDHAKWLDEFVSWLESRGEMFAGSTNGDSEAGGESVRVTPVVSHKRRRG